MADGEKPLGERTASDFIGRRGGGDDAEPLFKARHGSPIGRQKGNASAWKGRVVRGKAGLVSPRMASQMWCRPKGNLGRIDEVNQGVGSRLRKGISRMGNEVRNRLPAPYRIVIRGQRKGMTGLCQA